MTEYHDEGEHLEGPHRKRLLEGLRASIRERGYRDTQITHIVRHARTSRRTFYEEFETKDDCFVALLRANFETMTERIRGAINARAPWQKQIEQALRAYFAFVAEDPALARCYVRELSVLGQIGDALHREAMNSLANFAMAMSKRRVLRQQGLRPISRELAMFLHGGLFELTAAIVESGADIRSIADTAVCATAAVIALATDHQVS